jgi:terminal uridylyltransferase
MQQQYTNQSTESTLIQIQHLDQLAAQEIPKVEMKPEELEEKEVFRKYLEDICKNALVKNYSGDIATIALVGFGSLASGFATPGSDMDLAIVPTWKDVINAEKTEIDHNIPRLLERAILDAKLGARLLTRTRVPILKVCQHPTEELFTALFDERKKWDELPEGEQYPPPLPPLELAGQSRPLLKADPEPPGVVQQSNFPELDAIKPLQVNPETHKKAKSKPDPKPTGAVQNPNFPKLDAIKAYGVYLENLKKEKAKANALKFSTRKKESIPTTAGLRTPTIPLQGNTDSKNPKKESVPTSAGSPTPTTPLQGNTDSRDPKKERHPHHDRPWAREKTLGPLDFPKSGVGIQCDVNFENPLGIHNTQLLRCYSLCDPRVRPMVLFVKSWAKRRKINSSYSGTLSSYGWVLMVLHYLVNVAQPPVCPNLQLCRPSTGPQAAEEIVIQGHSVRFWRNEAEIIQAAKLHQLSRNMQSIGALLRGFFQYFSGLSTGYGPNRTPSFHWTGEVLSLRTQGGILTKQMKGWTGAKTTISNGREVRHRYLISIEDPFELDHNVARTVTHNGIVAIRDEFRRAWRIINAIGSGIQPEGGFFDEVVEKPPPPPTPETKEPALAQTGVGF